MIKRILLALADTEFAAATIRRTIELALFHEAEITAVTAINVRQLAHMGPAPIGAGPATRELVDYRLARAHEGLEAVVDEFESSCQSAGVDFLVEREAGNPFDLAISRSRYSDLMVCGLRHVFDEDLTANPDYAIVSLIDAGVRPILAEPEVFRAVNRVLVAYSGSMESAKTIKRFAQLHLWPNPLVRIVTYRNSDREARELLRDATTLYAAHGYEVESEHRLGSSERALLDDAEHWGADMIVLGNSARRLWFRRILGKTTSRVIQESEIPLFLAQ